MCMFLSSFFHRLNFPPSQTQCDPPHTAVPRNYIGENVSRKDKNKYLYTTVSIIILLLLLYGLNLVSGDLELRMNLFF